VERRSLTLHSSGVASPAHLHTDLSFWISCLHWPWSFQHPVTVLLPPSFPPLSWTEQDSLYPPFFLKFLVPMRLPALPRPLVVRTAPPEPVPRFLVIYGRAGQALLARCKFYFPRPSSYLYVAPRFLPLSDTDDPLISTVQP